VRDENLTKEEAAGLKSLNKRVSEGSRVVVQTDKSSRFAIMSLEEYETAGKKHTEKDQEVDMEFVKQNETNINDHMSMLLKIFMVTRTGPGRPRSPIACLWPHYTCSTKTTRVGL
jgi:hypothetical protein